MRMRPALAGLLLMHALLPAAPRTQKPPIPQGTPPPAGGINPNAAQVQPPLLASPGGFIKVTYPRMDTKIHQKSDPAKNTETWVRWDKQSLGGAQNLTIELWRANALVESLIPPGPGIPNDGERRVGWNAKLPPGGNYVIKIRTLDNTRFGFSDPFTILTDQSTEKLTYEPSWDQTSVTCTYMGNPSYAGWNPCQEFASSNQKKVRVGEKVWDLKLNPNESDPSSAGYASTGGFCQWNGVVRFPVKPGKIKPQSVIKALLTFKVLDEGASWEGTLPSLLLVVPPPGGFLDGPVLATNPSSPLDVTETVKAWLSGQPANGFVFKPGTAKAYKTSTYWQRTLGQFTLEVEYATD